MPPRGTFSDPPYAYGCLLTANGEFSPQSSSVPWSSAGRESFLTGWVEALGTGGDVFCDDNGSSPLITLIAFAVFPALRKQRQVDPKFGASLYYISTLRPGQPTGGTV